MSTRPFAIDRHFCLHSLGLLRWVEGDASLTVGSVLLSSCVIICEDSALGGRSSYSDSCAMGSCCKTIETRLF